MGIFDWFFEDVLGLDFGGDHNPYARGQDVNIHSTESYLPIFKGKVNDVKPAVVAFAGTSGDGTGDDIENDLIHKVFVYGKRVKSIDAVRVDGVDSESTDWQDNEGNRWLHVRKFPNGMSNYVWDQLQQAGFKSDYKFTECCCVYVVAEAGSEVVTSEPRDVRIDLTGYPVSSSLDGSSSAQQRQHNNVDHFFQWLTKDSSGAGWPESVIDLPSWRKAAKDCNIQIETYEGSGVYQSRYTFDYAIDTGMQVHEIIKIFRESIRAHMPFDHSSGKYHLILEQDDNYSDFEIYEEDIDGGIRTTESADVGKKVNQVIVKYPDAEQNGKMVEAIYPVPGSEIDNQWLQEDNQQRKSKSVTLDACTNHYLAMQQAKIEAEHSREGLQAIFTVKPRVYKLKPGEVVKVTSPERGWNAKPFRVLGKTLHKNLFSDLRLREHQPYIYDYHNTGEKPVIPDTTIDPNKLNAPTNLVVIDSAYGGKKATWVSTYAKFDWQLELNIGGVVLSGTTTSNTLELSSLVDGNRYTLAVRARNNIGKVSHWVESSPFTYVAPTPEENLPENPLNPVVPVPDVTDPAEQDQFVWKVYYDTIDHGVSPDTQAAFYGGLIVYSAGQTFTIPDALPNTDYYVWFGLVKRSQSNELPTQWTKRVVSGGTGLTSEHLSADLRAFIDLPLEKITEVEQDLTDTEERINQQIDLTNIQLGQYATDAINALFAQANANYITQEYVVEIEGFRNQVNHDLGQILVEGGAVKADEFIATRLLVDTHNGQISTLIQSQSQTDEAIETQASQIQQNAEHINLLTTSLGDSDFSALMLRLNQAENELVLSSVSAASANVNLINEIFSGANTAYELAAQGVNLSLAESKISTLSDENQSLAEQQQITLSLARGNEAAVAQSIKTISDAEHARATQESLLKARLDTQGNSIISTIERVEYVEANKVEQEAFSALRTQVEHPDHGLANAYLVLQSQRRIIDGKASNTAFTALKNAVEHPDYGLSNAYLVMESQQQAISQKASNTAFTALKNAVEHPDYGLANAYLVMESQQQTISQKASNSALAQLRSEVQHPSSGLASAHLMLRAQQDDLDNLQAEYFLGVDVNGRITGIHGHADNNESELNFLSDKINFVHPDTLEKLLKFNTSSRKLELDATFYAQNIDGDITDSAVIDVKDVLYHGTSNSTSGKTVVDVSISAQPFARSVFFTSIPIEWGDLPSLYISLYKNNTQISGAPGQVNNGWTPSPIGIALPANQAANFKIKVQASSATGSAIVRGKVLLSVFKQGSTITVN